MLVSNDSYGRIEEVPENCWRQALVEAKGTLLLDDGRSDSEGICGARGGGGLAVQLKPGLSEVYRKGGGLRHHGGERGEQHFGVGLVASIFFACFHR